MADQQYFYGTGRRKTAVARVRLYPGNGAIVINGKPMEDIFCREIHRAEVTSALRRLDGPGQVQRPDQVRRRRHHGLVRRNPDGHRSRHRRVGPLA